MRVEREHALMKFGRIVFTLTFTAAAIVAALAWSSKKAKADYPDRIYCVESGEYYNPKYHKCERIRQSDRLEYRESNYERARRIERERRAEIERRERIERERFSARFDSRVAVKGKVYGYVARPGEITELDVKRCPYPAIDVVGPPAKSEETALARAVEVWQRTVAWEHGERAMNIEFADGRRWTCGPIVPEPTTAWKKFKKRGVEAITAPLADANIINGVKTTVDQVCKFRAIPCNAPVASEVPQEEFRD